MSEERLSDLIKWETDATDLLDTILARVRNNIADEAKMTCFRNNQSKISKSVVLNVLHGVKPIDTFVSPED